MNPIELEQRVGSTIAERYSLVRLLGSGGMGAVYEGLNTWTQRRVAIKILNTRAAPDSELANRFIREARVTTQIAHENIVDVLDMGRDGDGALYIVQELLDGGDLRRLLDERKKLSPREALEIAVPVMSGLVAAHRQGITHRDIKPENIFLTRNAQGIIRPKLIDFGIAKIESMSEMDISLTRTGTTMGTPHYMAPEQARGEKTVDAQADIWSMGVVLYEMLTGRCPFQADNYNALLVEIISAEIPPVRELAPEVSIELAQVVHEALERDRTRRFKTIARFLGAVLECGIVAPRGESMDIALLPTQVRPSSNPGRLSIDPSAQERRPLTHSTMTQAAQQIGLRPRRSTAWRAAAVGTVIIVGLTVATVSRLTSHKNESRVEPISAGISAPPTTSLAPQATPHATYVVAVSAQPSSAVLVLDDETTSANSIVRRLPIDGVRHRLRASAPGYQTLLTDFVDASPPAVIQLARVNNTVTPPQPTNRGARSTSHEANVTPVTTHAAARTEPAPAQNESPHPARRTQLVNGAPVLEE